MKLRKIFILGKSVGVYRTKNFLKFLMDYKDGQGIYYNSIFSDSKLNKILNFLCDFLPFLKSNIVYVAAMCHNSNFKIILAKFFKKKIISEFYISYYDTIVNDNKKVSANSIKAKRYKYLDKYVMENSDITIFLNKTEAIYYSNVVGVDINKINYEIIPLCVDVKESIKLKFYNGDRDVFNICWWGTYIPLHGLDKIIETAAILKKLNFNFKIHIFGNSDSKSKQYKLLANEKKVSEYIIFNNKYTFSNGKLEQFLVENCDLVLGAFGNSQKAKNVITNKAIDGIALRSPVLTGNSLAMDEYFNGKDDVYFTENNPEKMANKIIDISKTSKEEIIRRINNTYNVYLNNFSVESFNNKMRKLLDRI